MSILPYDGNNSLVFKLESPVHRPNHSFHLDLSVNVPLAGANARPTVLSKKNFRDQ